MSRSDNNKNSIFDFAKTLLGQKPGGVCRIDERYDEYVIENSPTEEQLAAQRREDFSGMPVIAIAIAGETETAHRGLRKGTDLQPVDNLQKP